MNIIKCTSRCDQKRTFSTSISSVCMFKGLLPWRNLSASPYKQSPFVNNKRNFSSVVFPSCSPTLLIVIIVLCGLFLPCSVRLGVEYFSRFSHATNMDVEERHENHSQETWFSLLLWWANVGQHESQFAFSIVGEASALLFSLHNKRLLYIV